MNHFLFAGNHYYPRGGAEDMLGMFSELTDQNIFEAVIAALECGRIDHADRIWVNAFSHDGKTMGERRHWEVRIERELDNLALQFCSFKTMLERFGACGLMPLGRDIINYDDTETITLFPVLDPQRRDIRFLP